jgi:hypothetical protein
MAHGGSTLRGRTASHSSFICDLKTTVIWHFQGYIAGEACVMCTINFAHAARSQRHDDLVGTEFRAGL